MDNNEKGHGANYNEDEARLAAVRTTTPYECTFNNNTNKKKLCLQLLVLEKK